MGAQRFKADDFVDAALALLRSDPSSSLTLKAVGGSMGADTTAAYRHFRSKDALLSAIVDRLLADLVVNRDDDPRADLERIVGGLRSVLLIHPLVAQTVAGTKVIAPNAILLARRVAEDLAALGLSGPELVIAYQAIENFVLGSCLIDIDGAPLHWTIRRLRYAALDVPAFLDAADDATVERLSEQAFWHGIKTLLDAVL